MLRRRRPQCPAGWAPAAGEAPRPQQSESIVSSRLAQARATVLSSRPSSHCSPPQHMVLLSSNLLLWSLFGTGWSSAAVSASPCAACRNTVTAWEMCPHDTPLDAASTAGWASSAGCINAVVPGTVLANMLRNGTFAGVTDPFIDMDLAKIPDINSTGKPFYTRVYRTEISAAETIGADCRAASGTGAGKSRLWLHLRGISYFATVFVNGKVATPVQAPNQTRLAGMYHRWSFDLGPVSSAAVAVKVEPPEFCGRRDCKDKACAKCSCGQGGDHEIAKNAAMMQFTQGCKAPPTHTHHHHTHTHTHTMYAA